MQGNNDSGSPVMVILAFGAVYFIWGSTFFFIQKALAGFPPFLLGAFRFIAAGLLLAGWALLKGEKMFDTRLMRHAAVGGFLMLFIGNGVVIWVEQTLPSAMVAIMVSSSPLWFVILDRPKWGVNIRSRSTIYGLLFGFAGVVLLFGERLVYVFSQSGNHAELLGVCLLMIGVVAWAGGSLYAKEHAADRSTMAATSWQMFFAGVAFFIGAALRSEPAGFRWEQVSYDAGMSMVYLVIMGSIVGFSAYVWLLKVRPATQVSTFAYVNPVVAVILGVYLAGEKISWVQIAGLVIILLSVLLINLSAYIKKEGKV